jgi:hypothetical protein
MRARMCPTSSPWCSVRVATGHSILVIAYHLLSRREPYSDLGAHYFVQRQTKTVYKNRLVRQLERMGINVTLEPSEAASEEPTFSPQGAGSSSKASGPSGRRARDLRRDRPVR